MTHACTCILSLIHMHMYMNIVKAGMDTGIIRFA